MYRLVMYTFMFRIYVPTSLYTDIYSLCTILWLKSMHRLVYVQYHVQDLCTDQFVCNIMFRIYVPTSLCTISCLGSMYGLVYVMICLCTVLCLGSTYRLVYILTFIPYVQYYAYNLCTDQFMYNITFRIYVPTSLCTIFCLGSMYRLHNQGSEHSAVTNMYSVSNQASRSSTPTPAYPSSSTLAHRDSRDTRDTRSLINSRMSHSHTLPHSLSHHHSKFASIKGTVDYNYKYSTNYRGVGTIHKCTLNRFVLS